MGDMSEDQEKHLEVFRKYIQENNLTDHPQYDDYYLLRFLRARKFDMDKTILMFTTFLNWRKENDVDNIIDVSAFFLLHYPSLLIPTGNNGESAFTLSNINCSLELRFQ